MLAVRANIAPESQCDVTQFATIGVASPNSTQETQRGKDVRGTRSARPALLDSGQWSDATRGATRNHRNSRNIRFQPAEQFLVFRADVGVELPGEVQGQMKGLNQGDNVGEVFHASDAAGHAGGELEFDE